MFAFDEKIEKMLSDAEIAGCSVALTDREGVLYTRGFGRKIAEDPTSHSTEHTLYRAASITKVVTGLLTMRFLDRGILDIDAPVSSYLPWLRLKNEDAAEKITPRQLLSHTAGFPAEYTPEGPRDEGLLLKSLKEGLPTLDLVSLPGEGKYLYSNWGIRLLSAVLEEVGGERYSALATRYVLEPLGMNDSCFFLRDGVSYDLSMPHLRDEKGAPVSEKSIKENYCRLAVGGLYSSAVDLCRLARLLLRGGVSDSGERLVSAGAFSEMTREHALLKSGDGYGLTLQLHRFDGIEVIGHYGNADPYTSAMYADLGSGYGAVVLLNTYKDGLRRDICDMMLREARKLS